MGAVTIEFEVAGVPVDCRFLVSDAVDAMLGIDWLERNNCTWDFVRGTLLISGKEVPLVGRPRRPVVRRVYIMGDVLVLPRTQVDVPVRLAWTAFERRDNNTEWVMETKHTPQGVIVARSLLPKEGSKSFVRAINLSDQPCSLQSEFCVGSAHPAVVVGGRSVADSPNIMEDRLLGGGATRHFAGPASSLDPPPSGPATSDSINFEHLQPVVDGLPILCLLMSLWRLNIWCVSTQMSFLALNSILATRIPFLIELIPGTPGYSRSS